MVRSFGTRNFFLSIVGSVFSPARFSTMMGTRVGCLARMEADWLFRDSGAFARHRRSLYYADRGKTPRKKFMEECVEYLGWKS